MKNFIINNLKRILFALSVVITILLGALIVFTESSAVAPFVYALF